MWKRCRGFRGSHPQKFYQEPSNSVQPQIHGGHSAWLRFLCCIPEQDSAEQEVSCRGNQLRWNQLHAIRREVGVGEGNAVPRVCLPSVTAACKKAAETSEPLCHRDCRHNKIKIGNKICFLPMAVCPACQDAANDSAIYNITVLEIPQNRRILYNLRKLHDII